MPRRKGRTSFFPRGKGGGTSLPPEGERKGTPPSLSPLRLRGKEEEQPFSPSPRKRGETSFPHLGKGGGTPPFPLLPGGGRTLPPPGKREGKTRCGKREGKPLTRKGGLDRFHFCSASAYDQMPPAPHPRELPLTWRRPRTRPQPRCVQGQQRW